MTRHRTGRQRRRCRAACLCLAGVFQLWLAGCAHEPAIETGGEPTLADLSSGAVTADTGTATGDGQERAITAYRDYLARYPDSPERNDIRLRLADLLVQTAGYTMVDLPACAGAAQRYRSTAMQRYREAIALYEQLLREQPEHPERADIYYQLSKAYEETGQAEQATAVLDTLITQLPSANIRL